MLPLMIEFTSVTTEVIIPIIAVIISISSLSISISPFLRSFFLFPLSDIIITQYRVIVNTFFHFSSKIPHKPSKQFVNGSG